MMMNDGSRKEPFDWAGIKARLSRAQESLRSAESLNEAQIKALMAERSRQLARIPDRAIDTSELIEVVRFRLGSEEAAIETRFVLALMQPQSITPIPDTDDFFLGLTNLRGEITAIIDLGSFLGLSGETRRDAQVLVLGTAKPECAILVDELEHVTTIRKQDIRQPSGGLGSVVDLLVGCTADAIMIFDGDALLRCDRIYIDQNDQP
ncbi:Chemotaxis protein CheV [Stieleria maiorica]|uniref:Chemotaxis protein CheV n=1 Tax=Stieleria maiorica TaxID=2795974 RepID=A0A5B9MDP1_9BACT|nr:chemotaxis protein CheW [Stieleria maiorica]QEF98619.1 Chemotaxis protein CheV [Stieleria maiorica]